MNTGAYGSKYHPTNKTENNCNPPMNIKNNSNVAILVIASPIIRCLRLYLSASTPENIDINSYGRYVHNIDMVSIIEDEVSMVIYHTIT